MRKGWTNINKKIKYPFSKLKFIGKCLNQDSV